MLKEPLELRDLAPKLHDLSDLRAGRVQFYFTLVDQEKACRSQLRERETTLSRFLGALDLGLLWDDVHEMYVVYDLDSRKE